MSNVLNVLNHVNGTAKLLRINVTKEIFNNYTVDEFQKIKDFILENGGTQLHDERHLSGSNYYQDFMVDGIRFSVDYRKEKTKEEKIAELRKELVKLEEA